MFLASTSAELETQHAAAWSASRELAVEAVYADSRPPDDLFTSWELRTRWLALDGGRVTARLKKPAVVKVLFERQTLEVEGWGLTLPMSESAQIDREIARRLLYLVGKVESGTLTEEERNAWLHAVDTCDLDAFILYREQPQYMEGKLLRKEGGLRVEWQDGRVVQLSKNFAPRLDLVNEGEDFSCLAKITSRGEVVSIERVSILPAVATRIPESWPKKFSESISETSDRAIVV